MKLRVVLLTMLVAMTMAGDRVWAQSSSVSGTVAYRERIALPPTAVLEVTLEDVSRADAASTVVARVRQQTPGNPPIPFDLPYDPSRIDPRGRYAVRARILDGERLMFTSIDATLVLTQGRGATANLLLRMVPSTAPGPGRSAVPAVPAPAAPTSTVPAARPLPPAVDLTNLPATFVGTLPCADCAGLRYELNLFPDDSYMLRTTYVGRPATTGTDDLGSWVLSSDRRVIVLRGIRGTTEYFGVRDNTRLRKLDVQGQEIVSPQPYDLRRTPGFTPLVIRGTVTGAYSSVADTGRFVECSSGQTWAVAEEGAQTTLQQAYRAAGAKPGASLFVTVQGRVETRRGPDSASPRPTLVVDSIGEVRPTGSCAKRFASLPLEDTYWKLVALGTTEVKPAATQRNEASLVFRADPKSFSGSGGCNRLAGQYQIGSESLTLRAAGTMMACPGSDDGERVFTRALGDTRRYRILGTTLELFDAQHRLLARFEGR